MTNYERFGFLCPICDKWQYEYDAKKIYDIVKTGNMFCKDCNKLFENVVIGENELTFGIWTKKK